MLGSYLAVPMILAPILYVRQKNNRDYFSEIDSKYYYLFPALFFVFFAISIALLYFNAIRPYSYYAVITVMATLILAQILFFPTGRSRSMLILFQSSLLLLDIIWGVSLNYFFSIERTDSFFHSWMIQILVEEGTINENFDLYRNFPLWHILCAAIYKVSAMDMSYYKAMYLVNGVIFAAIPPGVYILSKKLFTEEKVALLAALFVSFYPEVLKYGIAALARSPISFLGILLVITLLYHRSFAATLMAIAMTISIIVFHTVSIPFLLAVFAVLYLLQRIYGVVSEQEIVDADYLAFAVAAMLAYWMYISISLFETIINNITASAPDEVSTRGVFLAPLNELFNYLHYSPLLFFLLIGTLEALRKDRIPHGVKVVCIAALLFTAVSFPGPGLLITKLGGNFNIDRFGEYVFFLIVFAASFGFYTIYTRSRRHLKSTLIILFMILVFLSVSNDFIASDNPLVKRPFYTFYLTEEEVNGFDHAGNTSRGFVMSDFVTTRYMYFTYYREKSHILEVDNQTQNIVKGNDSDLVLIRKGELERRPLRFYIAEKGFIKEPSIDDSLEYYYPSNKKLWSSLNKYDKIYDSSSISTYI
ncbi:hypothetical protein PV02_09815 [Methanolobus chelungpuianus]|uniref:Uncharacterized protein n=2 Tax=Methanolobus chelungpuianus TaxID=502115 RepID=A0AAE3HC72_9EURY|nr:hypothetical protein [Methanolobus chelungpuianus]